MQSPTTLMTMSNVDPSAGVAYGVASAGVGRSGVGAIVATFVGGGASVGVGVGSGVGGSVGSGVGVGSSVGSAVGSGVGSGVGSSVGVGSSEGASEAAEGVSAAGSVVFPSGVPAASEGLSGPFPGVLSEMTVSVCTAGPFPAHALKHIRQAITALTTIKNDFFTLSPPLCCRIRCRT